MWSFLSSASFSTSTAAVVWSGLFVVPAVVVHAYHKAVAHGQSNRTRNTAVHFFSRLRIQTVFLTHPILLDYESSGYPYASNNSPNFRKEFGKSRPPPVRTTQVLSRVSWRLLRLNQPRIFKGKIGPGIGGSPARGGQHI